MAEARQCDRCNEFYSINDNEKRGEYPITSDYKKLVDSMTLYDNNVNRIKHLDLCPVCSRSLMVWLNLRNAAIKAEKEEDITVKLCDICKYKNVLPECNPCRSCGSFNNFESKEGSE